MMYVYNKLNQSPNADPNVNYNMLHEVIKLAKDKHMPYKTVKFKKYKHTKSAWITLPILKSVKPALRQSLRLITNQILTTGIFPDKLKISKVVPIYKKGENTQLCNYRPPRPIYLLLAISKVIEK